MQSHLDLLTDHVDGQEWTAVEPGKKIHAGNPREIVIRVAARLRVRRT